MTSRRRNALLPSTRTWAFATGIFGGIALLLASLSPAMAQQMGLVSDSLTDDMMRGLGWSQIMNVDEMVDFFLALLEVALMTAAIAYHPIVHRDRQTAADFDEPRSLFIYALIGMIVGFIVMHHGYLIGFVIFGIGGLVRFKSDAGDMADNRRLILVMLIGLCAGLNLPVMAVIATVSAWIIIFFLGRYPYLSAEVHFDSQKLARLHVEALRDMLRERGFKVVTTTKQRFKPGVVYLVRIGEGQSRESLARELAAIQGMKVHGIDEWHVD